MTKRGARTGLLVCTALIATGLTDRASAQGAAAATGTTAPAEGAATGDHGDWDIVVTARRMSERIQDVPASVSALSSSTLEQQHVSSLSDIQHLSPAISFSAMSGVGTNVSVSMRGMVQTDAGITVDPSVGVYFNEVYIARTDGLHSASFDLGSVQVLKGPQGTLFGRNSVGGAVLIASRQPTDDFGGYVSAAVEAPYGYRAEAAVNIPFSDTVKLRVAGLRDYVQGYAKVLGRDFRLDDRNRWSGRATLSVDLTPDLKSVFVVDGFQSRANGTAINPLFYNSALILPSKPIDAAYIAQYNAYQARGNRDVTQSFKPYNRADTAGLSNTTTFQITPQILLKNIIGWRRQKSDDAVDQDGTSADVLSTTVLSRTHQFSEEFQLQGKFLDDKLSVVTGLYYFRESGINYAHSWVRSVTFTPPGNENRFFGANTAKSIFFNANYQLPTAVTAHIFGGIRYTGDDREVQFRTRLISATGAITCRVEGAPAGNCSLQRNATFRAPTWTGGVDIKPIDQVLLYGSVSRGYRSGGFSGRATAASQQNPYQPEYATSFEVGTKTDWALGGDVRATFNASGYYVKYNNIQRELRFVDLSSGGIVAFVVNAARARMKGLELEGRIAKGRDLSLSGYFSVVDAKYLDFQQLGVDQSGNAFSYVPKYTAGATFDWTVLRSDLGSFGFNANWSHRSGYYLDLINVPGVKIDAYDLFNAAINWNGVLGSQADLQFYVKNIGDTRAQMGGQSQAGSLGVSSVYYAPPRVFGVSLRVPFGD